ncbi:MAG: hypothetical protein F9K16_04320 [Thermoanaerobaculia bacterium]|nr:MAG: hypothetical protein F9K16_04320 [Thermoanaerobaculia bacterium]MBZ0100584.1 hypothetical protein [Thermoanaerobaculia bacterium]
MTSPSGRIFHLENGTLSPLDESPFSLENQLQKLLAGNPDLLPGDQMDPEEPRRFLLTDLEVTVTGDATTWACPAHVGTGQGIVLGLHDSGHRVCSVQHLQSAAGYCESSEVPWVTCV